MQEATDLVTTVSSESAILRYLNDISSHDIPLFISPAKGELPQTYRSKIARIDIENKQLVLHQLKRGDRLQRQAESSMEMEVTCYIQSGTLKFSGQLDNLGDNPDSMYCRLPIPAQLSRKQLRSAFRVSLTKYQTQSVLKLEADQELHGVCKDISANGALVQIQSSDLPLTSGGTSRCHIHIPELLELSCAVEFCHVETSADASRLVGLHFLDLDLEQQRMIKAALIRIERQNITN